VPASCSRSSKRSRQAFVGIDVFDGTDASLARCINESESVLGYPGILFLHTFGLATVVGFSLAAKAWERNESHANLPAGYEYPQCTIRTGERQPRVRACPIACKSIAPVVTTG
jgi:hypothetical protein